jgi:hypothetical protein
MMKLISLIAVAAIGSVCGCSSGDDDAHEGTPVGFTFEAIGDRSFASFGWAGTVHDVAVSDGTPFSVKTVDCQGTDGPCKFEGPVQLSSAVNRRRCVNRTSVECQTDNDCPAQTDGTPHGSCVFIYDQPTSTPLLSNNGTGACGWSYIPITAAGGAPAIVGTLDQTSGEVTFQTLTVNLVLNGPSGFYRGGCSECVGDTTPNDGKKEGKCMKASNSIAGNIFETSPDIADGTPCDVNNVGSTPGFTGNYSMDCSPTVAVSDGPPTPFGGSFSSAGLDMSIDNGPSCTDPAHSSEKCFCGVCSDTITACSVNSDCPSGGTCGYVPAGCTPNPLPGMTGFDPALAPGQCKGTVPAGKYASVVTKPNDCVDACQWDPVAGLGSCKSALFGTTVGCYPGGAGTSIGAAGHHEKKDSIYIVDTAGAACTGPSPLASLSRQLGLPGLVFQKRSFRIVPEFSTGAPTGSIK